MQITVNTIIEKLKPFSAVTFPTLREQSKFDVIISDDGIVTIINSGNNSCVLDDAHVFSVNERYEKLLNRKDGSHLKAEYNTPEAKAPSFIFSPYLARIIHFVHSGE
ncbi:MAG: hypothetical protein PHN45_11835 [Methylococcales bacterium]|nr:hypothetical protein [Methylococcales bacterium]MDD5755425.1 hypothetical protein [Methylococcales bacterium]